MERKIKDERPIWFWPLMAFLLPMAVGGLIFWVQVTSEEQRQRLANEKASKPQPRPLPQANQTSNLEPIKREPEPVKSTPEPEIPDTTESPPEPSLTDTGGGNGGSSLLGNQDVRLMVYCEDALKKRLKNPDSYQRVEVVTKGDKAAMTYRSTNSFGAVVTENALCIDGDPIQIFPVR